MAIAVLFTPVSMNAAQYDGIIRRLQAVNAFPPPHLVSHTCFGAGDQLRVMDVWESRESFERFGQTLLPILQTAGVDPGAPQFFEVHNVARSAPELAGAAAS
ncbi:MAG TPA: hypothetical protein VFJ82_12820 [Longimicrobium sp.]|nr:hypothetical protein [Longimicrobium sp.]